MILELVDNLNVLNDIFFANHLPENTLSGSCYKTVWQAAISTSDGNWLKKTHTFAVNPQE
jgi:hypothetical protein